MPDPTLAAGILFRAPDKQVLFLKRGPGGDHPGEWCFPGGHVEAGETREEGARREAREELGEHPEGRLKELARSVNANQLNPAALAPLDALASTPAEALPENPLPQLGQSPGSEPGRVDPQPLPGELVDYTTYLQDVKETFEPRLDGEHVGFAWAPQDQPPEPLHPGCRVALERLTMDELGIARAISQGRLTSPQRYENLLLVAMRITGTGMAYRRALDEYVWRDPAVYLNQEFLDRCNGLAVVWEHPKKSTLDSDEYAKRVIGAVMLPYLAGDEVWGVVKVYDEEAARELEDGRLSTSPGVVFRDPSVNSKVTLENGSTLLIEGKPSLLDHLAVCGLGVWDKRGEPRGVLNVNGERADSMADDEKAAAEKRREEEEKMDADAGQKLDKLLERLDAVNARLDSYEAEEKARKDAEEEALKSFEKEEKEEEKDTKGKVEEGDKDAREDDTREGMRRTGGASGMTYKVGHVSSEKGHRAQLTNSHGKVSYLGGTWHASPKDAHAEAREHARGEGYVIKDSDESEKEKEEMEERHDSQISALRAEIEELKRRTKPLPEEDRAKFADEQYRADSAYQAFGQQAPAPMAGERLHAYKVRLAKGLQRHSQRWGKVDLVHLTPEVLALAQADVYADAQVASRNPDDVPAGTLREIVKVDRATGQRIVTFAGPHTIFKQFNRPARRVTGINTQRGA